MYPGARRGRRAGAAGSSAADVCASSARLVASKPPRSRRPGTPSSSCPAAASAGACAPTRSRQNLRDRARHRRRRRAGGPADAPVAPGGRVRCRRVRGRTRGVGGPLLAHPGGGARAERGPGVVNRVAVALGARAAVSLPGTALRGAIETGNPVRAEIASAAADAARGPCRGVAAPRWRVRRQPRCPSDQRRDARSRGPLARPDRCGDPPRCRSARLPTVRAGVGTSANRSRSHHLRPSSSTKMTCRRSTDPPTSSSPGPGAVTVAELAVLAMPAVIVPLPGAPSDHQSANAAALVQAGAAVAVRRP